VSQPLGDLENNRVFEAVDRLKTDWFGLYRFEPGRCICDLHPAYVSRALAAPDTPLVEVQHHHAHIASVMVEHGLTGPLIGVAFDGTGYGTDGRIWGGEFLICEGAKFVRAAHLRYVKIIGGDAAARDAAKTAYCYLRCIPAAEAETPAKMSPAELEIVDRALDLNINTVYTSSMGRLFDVAACLLGLCDYNRYEGECAMRLERAAELALDGGVAPAGMSLDIISPESDEGAELLIDPGNALRALNRREHSVPSLALGFHVAVAEMTAAVCTVLRDKSALSRVALSGGVFQNKILTELIYEKLGSAGFEVYRNLLVPPNDGGIALGQAAIERN
jgi:hydrogenase maturation protein HypF